jgi:hypothetical protein
VLNAQLGAAEGLVIGWRRNGFLYFQQDILQEIIGCGQTFLAAQPTVDALFATLAQGGLDPTKAAIADELAQLTAPIGTMITSLDGYLDKLSGFQGAISVPHGEMTATIAQVQAQEASIQGQIETINQKISAMNVEIQTDRQAIASARAAEHRGIWETVFGVLLAPVTLGGSLVLAGIGVASIAEAESMVASLQSTLDAYQGSIASDQASLSDDQRQIATLSGLSASVGTILDDLSAIDTALDPLRTTWATLQGELQGIASKVRDAGTAQEALVAQVWFDAACIEWKTVVASCEDLSALAAPSPNIVAIGG